MDQSLPTASARADHSAAEELVDQQVFQSLVETFAGDEEGGIAEVFALFFEHMPARFEALREALATQNVEALRAAAHSMKGSCANFGAAAMAVVCVRLEEVLALPEPKFDEAGTLVRDLLAVYQRTERQILDLIQ